jgi:hypothetical protein
LGVSHLDKFEPAQFKGVENGLQVFYVIYREKSINLDENDTELMLKNIKTVTYKFSERLIFGEYVDRICPEFQCFSVLLNNYTVISYLNR